MKIDTNVKNAVLLSPDKRAPRNFARNQPSRAEILAFRVLEIALMRKRELIRTLHLKFKTLRNRHHIISEQV